MGFFSLIRQGRTDSERAACFVNALSTYNVGATGKPMTIFFDNLSLEDGVEFDVTFMWGMCRALVAVPFVTADALARMCQSGAERHIDNVLLEWWLALVLKGGERTQLKYILPIFCGKVRARHLRARSAKWASTNVFTAQSSRVVPHCSFRLLHRSPLMPPAAH